MDHRSVEVFPNGTEIALRAAAEVVRIAKEAAAALRTQASWPT